MRLWSLHPRYLDRQGLNAGWREGLSAQAVVEKSSGGYSHRPQLQRFRASEKLRVTEPVPLITVTDGQLAYERALLAAKLQARSPEWLAQLGLAGLLALPVLNAQPSRRSLPALTELSSPPLLPASHPSFTVVPGPIDSWERPRL